MITTSSTSIPQAKEGVKLVSDAFATAYKLLSLGYSVIPSGGGDSGKAPRIIWQQYQTQLPTLADLERWNRELQPTLWGIVTGPISGILPADADTAEARAIFEDAGLKPHTITPRGQHFYFKYPGYNPLPADKKQFIAAMPGVDFPLFVNVVGINPITKGEYRLINLPTPDTLIPWDRLPARVKAALNGSKPAAKATQGRVIPNGQRNATATKIAGAMRRQGADRGAIEAALSKLNYETPLSEKEIEAIAGSVAKYEPQPDADRDNLLTLTDVGNSERMVALHGKKLRYSYERGLWLLYTGKRWEWDAGGEIIKLAKETARKVYLEAANEPDDNKREALAKHAKASQNNQRIKAMIELARAELAIKIEDLNADQYLLNCNNGTINLRTGELKSHNPDDLLTYYIPLDYEPGANSQVWQGFIHRIFEDNEGLISYVQKSLGYSITGCQDEQALWFNHGPGSNGKTTLMGIIIDILGDYATEIDPLAFVVDKNSRTGPNEALASLYNKRFAAATEVKTGMTLDVALIKRMTGGEMIRCERKFEHGFNFKPTHKLWLSGNHEPRIADTTNSIWNRLKYIPFKATIEEKERIKGLRNLISRNHGTAVLAWLVEGCRMWQSEGLGEPVEVKEAIQAYRESQDVLHDYLLELCVLESGATILVADLYREYKGWAEKNDIKPMGKITFGNRLKEKGLTTYTGNRNQQLWYGIRLLTEAELVKSVNSVRSNPGSSQANISCIETSQKTPNKLNKLNKQAQLDEPPIVYSDEIAPEYPVTSCRCGSWDYWLRGNDWVCSKCHPEPEGGLK